MGALLPAQMAGATPLPGQYGSGAIGNWQAQGPPTRSTAAQFTATKAADGVFCYGDSIGVLSFYDLAVRMYDTEQTLLAVDAWNGRPTEPTVTQALADFTTYGVPSRVLMAIGTNDIFTPPVFAAQVERLVAAVPAATKVFWVDVQACRTPYAGADQRNSMWLNMQLLQVAAKHPNLAVISWATFLAADPQYRLNTYLQADYVHPTPAGVTARNGLIIDAIKR